MDTKIIIAIDGFSSTGKSTVAKQLAKDLEYVYVDTGAMYRAVALFAARNGLIASRNFNVQGLITKLPEIKLKFVFNEELGFSEIHLNGENVEKEIRQMEVSSYVSRVATVPEVRELLVAQQQKIGKKKGIVMDGRDIGTVVFPDAELKIFMTASPEVRAKRRYDELLGRNEEVTYEEVYNNVCERDNLDSTREDSPLRKAEGAVEVDSSFLTPEEQYETIMELYRQVVQ